MKSRKKVIQIITLSENAGAQQYIRNVVNFSRNKVDHQIICGAGGGAFNDLNIKKHSLKNLIRPINLNRDLKAFKEIKNILKKENPDVVHCHSSKAGVLGRLAAKAAGIKTIIYTAHGFVFKEPINPVKKIIYYMAEKFAAKFTDKLICVSKEDYDYALKKKFVPKSKLFYIPNGIDLKKFTHKGRRPTATTSRGGSLSGQQGHGVRKPGERSAGVERKKGICVANFYKTKGHKYLVKAMQLLKDKDIQIDLVGSFGPEKKKLEKMIARYQLTDKIKFLGHRKDIPQLLPRYDFFVLPSVKEGFPYSIIEAAAAGLPLVGTRVGGIKEVINKTNGVLCKAKDVLALSKALNKISESPRLSRAKSRGTSETKIKSDMKKLEKYDIRSIVARIVKLY